MGQAVGDDTGGIAAGQNVNSSVGGRKCTQRRLYMASARARVDITRDFIQRPRLGRAVSQPPRRHPSRGAVVRSPAAADNHLFSLQQR